MAGCINDSRSGCRGLGSSAVGYWGRSIYKRLQAEQEFAKQRALLQDELLGVGIRVNLWQGVESGTQCSCYKNSNKQADRKCKSCHGVIDGYIPGYLKFGYNTLWMSANDTDVTLTNVEITTDFRSAKAGLTSGSLSGTIESADKTFSRTAIGSVWETNETSFLRDGDDSTVTVEYSLDSGSTWTSIADLPTANPSSGTIRFRATLTRTSTSILTPFFEIIRARYATLDLKEERGDGTYTYGPWIRLLNSKPFKGYQKSEHGDFPTTDTMTVWTSGLSMFDSSIEVNTAAELLNGPNVIFEILDGALAGTRYLTLNWQHSDPAAYQITTQTFKVRREDPVSPFALVW